MAGKYDKPSRFNLVSFIFFLVVAGLVYGAIQFGPPYYRRWKAAAVISEMVNRFYADRLKGGDASTEVQNHIRTELLSKFKEVGIDDPAVQTTFRKSATAVSIDATYHEVVKHWFVNKTTTLEFTVSEEAKKEKE
jgi:hypothetical protein